MSEAKPGFGTIFIDNDYTVTGGWTEHDTFRLSFDDLDGDRVAAYLTRPAVLAIVEAITPGLLSAAREALAAFEAEPCISDRGSGRTFDTPYCDECCCPDAETCGQLERGEIQTDAEGRCLCEHCHGDGGVRYMAKLDAICKKSQAVKQLRAAIERAGGGR